MRRDEIKLFPGNVETHIERINRLTDSTAAPLAAETPSPPAELRPQLDDSSPGTRLQTRLSLESFLTHLISGCMLIGAVWLLVYLYWDKPRVYIWLLIWAYIVLLPVAVWFIFRLIKARRRRG